MCIWCFGLCLPADLVQPEVVRKFLGLGGELGQITQNSCYLHYGVGILGLLKNGINVCAHLVILADNLLPAPWFFSSRIQTSAERAKQSFLLNAFFSFKFLLARNDVQ